MKKIKLSKGDYAIVDNEDFARLSSYKWQSHNGYARRTEWVKGGKGKQLHYYMHREVADAFTNKKVDHINRDRLDNRKENLRLVDDLQNSWNRGLGAKNKSGIKGVSWDKANKKWVAHITHNGKAKNLGRYNDLSSAAKVYQDWSLKIRGEEFTDVLLSF